MKYKEKTLNMKIAGFALLLYYGMPISVSV
jgi:hypothetical protein